MSSAVAGSPVAAIITLYQEVRTTTACIIIAPAVVYIYDYILCLGREYQYVWHSGKSKASRLVYLYIRYLSLVNLVYAVATMQPISDTSCIAVGWSLSCLVLLALIGPAIITTLRTYVLSGRNKLLGGIAMMISLGPLLVNVITIHQSPPANFPPPINCASNSTMTTAEHLALTVVSRSCAIIADCITIVVTWRATRTSRKVMRDSFQQPSLQDVMWTNGNIYFITVVCGNLLDLILATLSITDPENNANWPIGFIDPITSILNCRFLLDLYETNARLERGGSSFSQSDMGTLSLHFNEFKAAHAPGENSHFLGSFSGPVLLDSFSDESEDTALDTVDEKPEAEPSIPAETTPMAMAAGGSNTAA